MKMRNSFSLSLMLFFPARILAIFFFCVVLFYSEHFNQSITCRIGSTALFKTIVPLFHVVIGTFELLLHARVDTPQLMRETRSFPIVFASHDKYSDIVLFEVLKIGMNDGVSAARFFIKLKP